MPFRLNVRMEMPDKDPREFIYEFDQERVTLGRDSNNDIQIPLTTVSRHHAAVLCEGDEHYIEDLRSTHGTMHNGAPLGQGGKKLLRDGDVVQVMHFKIAFQRVAERPLEFASSEKTEQLARRMVQEVLSSMGDADEEPYLRVMNGPDEGKRFELTDAVAEMVIGRGGDCDLVINDANISRRHATVRKDWGGISIEDMGSKNGVVINESRIQGPTALQDSDEIMLGAVRLTFIDPTASFLGRLDGIPAFDDLETVASKGLTDSDDEDAEDDGDEDEDDGEGGDDGDMEPDDYDTDEAPELDPDASLPPEDADAPIDKPAIESPATDRGPPTASVGKLEILILVGVIVVVLGLVGGLLWFLLLADK